MNHAALSMGSPIQLVQPFVFPMPSSMLSPDTPVELSPALGKGAQGEEVASDWSLDQFPLPFPSPDLTSDDQSANSSPSTSGECSAFAMGTSQSSGYTKRQHVTDPNDAYAASPPQPPSSKSNNQAQMRTRHQIAAAWWRGINAKRIAKANSPTEQPGKDSPPVPLSPVSSPPVQPSKPPSALVHPLQLATNGTNDPTQPSLSLSQSQIQSPVQTPILSPFEQIDLKQPTAQPQFQMAPQFPYQPQLSADMQPVFFHPFQYVYTPMIPSFRSSIDIFGNKNDTSANWGTSKMGSLTNADNIPKPLDPSCTTHSTPCSTPQYPTFTANPYSLTIPSFEYSAPTTHNTYYITNVNNSTICAPNSFPYASPQPTSIPTPAPSTPVPPPPMPSPFSPPTSLPSESSNNASQTTNYNFTCNATFNNDFNCKQDENEFEFGADLNSCESAGNFGTESMDSSASECESAQPSSHTVEASEESEENETDEMEEEEEEDKNDSDSDYEEDENEGHSHKINILVNTGASRPPVVSVRATMNTRKRNAESATVIETTQTVHTEVRSNSRKNKRPESPSSPSKDSNNETKDKSKGWKWHEYNAQEPKKRRTTSTYSFTSSPCPKI